jgi:thiol:disulfide interchange protein DsbA
MKVAVHLLLAWGLLWNSSSYAGQNLDPFKPGVSYKVLNENQVASGPSHTVNVVEFFWYGCPDCFHFQPYFKAWLKKKPDYVHVIRVPATINPDWRVQAQAYYTAQLLGVEKRLNSAIYKALHVKHNSLDNKADFERFFLARGVSGVAFRKAWDSATVEKDLKKSAALERRYDVIAVPTLVIDGRYSTSSYQVNNNWSKFIRVIKFLIKKQHDSMRALGTSTTTIKSLVSGRIGK